jgi:hypothetical protein
MMRLALTAVLTAFPLLPAAAAPGCTISPITGMMTPAGATVSMQVTAGSKPCGAKLWVQPGVIPYTALRATRQPLHGHLVVSDPTQFSYAPDADYQGSDTFEILGRGNDRSAGQVTGTLKVNVTVSRH